MALHPSFLPEPIFVCALQKCNSAAEVRQRGSNLMRVCASLHLSAAFFPFSALSRAQRPADTTDRPSKNGNGYAPLYAAFKFPDSVHGYRRTSMLVVVPFSWWVKTRRANLVVPTRTRLLSCLSWKKSGVLTVAGNPAEPQLADEPHSGTNLKQVGFPPDTTRSVALSHRPRLCLGLLLQAEVASASFSTCVIRFLLLLSTAAKCHGVSAPPTSSTTAYPSSGALVPCLDDKVSATAAVAGTTFTAAATLIAVRVQRGVVHLLGRRVEGGGGIRGRGRDTLK